jgi:hypothetical protein
MNDIPRGMSGEGYFTKNTPHPTEFVDTPALPSPARGVFCNRGYGRTAGVSSGMPRARHIR